MKASSSGRPEPARLAPWLLAAAFAISHLAFPAPSLEDIDSINFALALRHFDVAEHQPHPPGYPVYVAAGRLSLALVTAFRSPMPREEAEALALSALSAVTGGLAVLGAWHLFARLASAAGGLADAARVARWATLILACSPLFWATGLRPMSDMPGLAAVLGAQALILSPRLYAGALLAGLSVGVRSQALWLTLPLLLYVLAMARAPGRRWAAAIGAWGAGIALWAVPLLVLTGGLDAYLSALGSQAGEDFAFVDMLWADPSARRLAFGLLHTLVLPWAAAALAAVMLLLSIGGAAVLLVRDRPALAASVAAFAPYAVFHLVFQETVTVRYALPVLPPVALLAAQALAATGAATNILATPIVVASLLIAVPGMTAYAGDRHPAFRAIADAERRAEVEPPALVTSHFELRRPVRAAAPRGLPVVLAPHGREWMEMAGYWAGGGTGAVWFLANPQRTDLDLIDRHSRRDAVRYAWAVAARPEWSGTRPANVDWYRLQPPGWFLGEGWSLTPETGGLAQAMGTGPDRQPIVAHVRHHAGAVHLAIGGVHLGGTGSRPLVFEITLAGRPIDRWTVTAAEGAFLRFLDLPDGVPGNGGYARLTVQARPAEGEGTVPAAIRQFDIQPASRVIFGLGEGWHEEELDVRTGRRWRWTAGRAIIRARGPGALRVRVRGESPLAYFDAPPTIALTAGARTIARLQPAADWDWDVVVPADAVAAAHGELALETTRVFVPAETEGSSDTRRLGLRVFAIDVAAAR